MTRYIYTIVLTVLLVPMGLRGQAILTTGTIPVASQLVPFSSSCFAASPTNSSVCGFTSTFQFTSSQCCACPTSGMVCLPGSVGYGGPGSSSSFTSYHTLSYSPSNEHQRITFSQKINRFQWSASGPWGAAEQFQIQVFDGVTLLNTFNFTVPGTGLNNKYYISAPQFDRLDFTEIQAISADDELFGDFRITTAGCPLAADEFTCGLDVDAAKQVRVHWDTKNEFNNLKHVLYHSTDAQGWDTLAQLPALNGSENHYSFTHRGADAGMNYYFVQIVTPDGNDYASHIMEAQFEDAGALQFRVFPNPASDRFHVDFQGLIGDKDVTLVNSLGQIVLQQRTNLAQLEIDGTALESGLYFVHVATAAGKSAIKVNLAK